MFMNVIFCINQEITTTIHYFFFNKVLIFMFCYRLSYLCFIFTSPSFFYRHILPLNHKNIDTASSYAIQFIPPPPRLIHFPSSYALYSLPYLRYTKLLGYTLIFVIWCINVMQCGFEYLIDLSLTCAKVISYSYLPPSNSLSLPSHFVLFLDFDLITDASMADFRMCTYVGNIQHIFNVHRNG